MPYHIRVLNLPPHLVQSGVGRHEYLAVLLHQLGEVVKQRVLLAEEVELVVPLLTDHQFVQEMCSVAGHKLSSQLYNVPTHSK